MQKKKKKSVLFCKANRKIRDGREQICELSSTFYLKASSKLRKEIKVRPCTSI